MSQLLHEEAIKIIKEISYQKRTISEFKDIPLGSTGCITGNGVVYFVIDQEVKDAIIKSMTNQIKAMELKLEEINKEICK